MSLFSPLQVWIAISTNVLRLGSVYVLHKIIMADNRFVDFCHMLLDCSLFSQISLPGHCMVDTPGAWEVWWQFSNESIRRS